MQKKKKRKLYKVFQRHCSSLNKFICPREFTPLIPSIMCSHKRVEKKFADTYVGNCPTIITVISFSHFGNILLIYFHKWKDWGQRLMSGSRASWVKGGGEDG